MAKMNTSIEELVEDWAKKQLSDAHVKFFTKTEPINSEIQAALEKAPSKGGGTGTNYPDIKVLVITSQMRHIPVMIEVKGKKGDLIKEDENGGVANSDAQGKPCHKNIKKYAVNGAVHYAHAIINHTESYNEVIAIGINGYKDAGKLITELGVYYVSKDNLLVPKKIADFTSLSFLAKKNVDDLVEQIDNLSLTDQEIEQRTLLFENQIADNLKDLNQEMHDVHHISDDYRVKLISGLIMAGLGVKDKVSPLSVSDLKGDKGSESHDGKVVINKIKSFLNEKKLPAEKREMIVRVLEQVFVDTDLHEPIDGESRLKKVYAYVHEKILPFFHGNKYHIDFTGKLFNTLNSWVKVPDRKKNDVVLTPRYVCEMMARLCQVNKDSYVWDYALGSAGFLISAMKLMIKDAENKLAGDPEACRNKIRKIKEEQLLGVECEPDIYILAVLNMILMGDGSTNIIYGDSLKYSGYYEQGDLSGEPFPANVFLLNPPYSAEGKGLVFVEKALERMSSGRAAVLIMENAGKDQGLPYSKNILKHSTLVASIHMSDIFKGKAVVQTAIYLFEVGCPHDPERLVKFIDFSNDGYTRQNRKNAKASLNLKNTDHATERYEELVAYVLGRKRKTNFLDNNITEDTITLEGNDWTIDQHKKTNSIPQAHDFQSIVSDYLDWMVKTSEHDVDYGKIESCRQIEELLEEFIHSGGKFSTFRVGDLFDIQPTKAYKMTNPYLFRNKGNIPVVTNSSKNNGISGYVDLPPTEKGGIITFSDTTTSNSIFYQPNDFIGYPHVQGMYPKVEGIWDENMCLYFITAFRKTALGQEFDYGNKFNRDIAAELEVVLPTMNGEIAKDFIQQFMSLRKSEKVEMVKEEQRAILNAYLNVIKEERSL